MPSFGEFANRTGCDVMNERFMYLLAITSLLLLACSTNIGITPMVRHDMDEPETNNDEFPVFPNATLLKNFAEEDWTSSLWVSDESGEAIIAFYEKDVPPRFHIQARSESHGIKRFVFRDMDGLIPDTKVSILNDGQLSYLSIEFGEPRDYVARGLSNHVDVVDMSSQKPDEDNTNSR
jgi:hypothetical protein